ncbi:hypothetical protein [Asanoa siamensis]|uniref:hypothetical protein n=1 Tax=Asanoa siamensis TaxID=926357 RepID=UPI0035717A14
MLTGAQTTPVVSPSNRWWRRPGAAVVTAVAFGVAALGYRVAVLLAGAPPTNSDEGTMGLAALHIGQGRGLPVYFYGQNYMGTLEAYLAAPLVALANGSVLALRLPNLLLFAAFLAAMWAMTRRLYSPWFATFVVGLLALGSDRILKNQLISGGGYPEINPAGAALMLLAVALAAGGWAGTAGGPATITGGRAGTVGGRATITNGQASTTGGRAGTTGGRAGTTGGRAGTTGGRAGTTGDQVSTMGDQVSTMGDQVSTTGGHPSTTRSHASMRGGRARIAGYAAFGLLTGLMVWVDWLVLPYLAAATAVLLLKRPDRRGWIALAGGALVGVAPLLIHDLTSSWKHSAIPTFFGLNGGGPDASWADQLHGGVLTGIPLATGMCAAGRCEPWQLWWAPVWLLLLAAAGYGAWRAFRNDPDRVRAAGRLALVAAALVSLLVYARSNAAGATPMESGRYLHCLLISTPAVLWPLWSLRGRATRWLGAAGLAVICAFALVATGMVVRELPRIAAVDDRQPGLLAELDRRGVTTVYSEYWTCNYIAYISAERVRCAVIGADLKPGFDRYQPYKRAVAAAPTRTFALPTDSAESRAVRDYLDTRRIAYESIVVSGYDLYQPATRVDLPLPD